MSAAAEALTRSMTWLFASMRTSAVSISRDAQRRNSAWRCSLSVLFQTGVSSAFPAGPSRGGNSSSCWLATSGMRELAAEHRVSSVEFRRTAAHGSTFACNTLHVWNLPYSGAIHISAAGRSRWPVMAFPHTVTETVSKHSHHRARTATAPSSVDIEFSSASVIDESQGRDPALRVGQAKRELARRDLRQAAHIRRGRSQSGACLLQKAGSGCPLE